MPVQNPFSLQFNGNITEWNSVALGNPTTWGTAATGQVVIGVNAEMFAGTTALSATGSSLNVNITGGTFGGTLSNNTAAPAATNLGVLPAIAETAYTTVTYTTGNQVLPVTDLHGALNQDLQAYAGTQLTGTVTAYGTAPTGNVFGVNAFVTNTVPVTLTSTTITGTVAVTQSTSPWVVSLASTTITGTVAVTQSTSPWVVSLASTTITGTVAVQGALTNNNAAPTATLLGVMSHIAETAYTTVTYTTGDVVLATTDLHGATNVDLQAYAGTALGAGSNYGTSPGAVNVMGVNAFITNTVPVTLTSTTITGTVAVTQSTSPWVVAGNLTHNNAAPAANNVGVLPAVASTAAPTYTTGDQVLLSTDLSGNLRVTFAAASEQNVNVNQWAGTALGTPANYGTSPGAVIAGSVNAFITNTVPVTLASTTITGTVAVTQSTSPWVVSLASTTITGTVAVNGALTNNNAAPTATLIGVLPAIAETAYTTVTYTTGDMVLPVTDLHGALNQDLQAYAGTQLTGTVTAYGTAPTGNVFGVNAFITNTVPVTQSTSPWVVSGTVTANQGTSPWVVSLASTTITGTVAVTQSTSPWVVSLTSTTITGTVAVTQSTSPWVVDGNLTNNNAAPAATNVGVLPAIAETAYTTITYTTGNQVLPVVDLHGAMNTDLQAVAGTAVVTAAAGVQKVGIVGNANATLDSTVASGTAPTNALAVSGIYDVTQPAPTNGQATALQQDESANLLVYPGLTANTGAAWSSATAVNTLQFTTGTATVGQPLGGQSVVVQLDMTTTLTGGAVTFQGTYDGTNWVTIPIAQVLNPQTYQTLTNPYTFVASTNTPFLILLQGFQNIRLNLTTVITGTGTVTPHWTVLQGSPVQVITSVPSSTGGTSVATGSIGATKTAIKTSGGNVYGWYIYNSNSSVAFVQFFNVASAGVTLGTTAPTQSIGIPPGSAANMAFDTGIQYGTAITIAITTTRAGAVGPTNTVDYNIFYV